MKRNIFDGVFSRGLLITHFRRSFVPLVVVLFIGMQCTRANAQVNITTGTYSQDFGATDITSWTNNVTYTGWYAYSHLTAISGIVPHANITNSAPSNTGNFYTYECNGNNDQKIGSRPSNTIPGTTGRFIRYGVYLRNTTGQTISSIRVQYEGFQLSLAENVGVVNSLKFHYSMGVGLPSMTGAGTSVVALDYVAPQDHPGPGNSLQLTGYPCTESAVLSACIPVNLVNNWYILLRWSDENDANNDHHLAIDNVVVDFGIDLSTICDILLPIELISFDAEPKGSVVELTWSTASEVDNAYFTVERSLDGLSFDAVNSVPAVGNSMQVVHYRDVDHSPHHGLSYYRLRQTDVDGSSTLSRVLSLWMREGRAPLSIHSNAVEVLVLHDYPIGTFYEVFDLVGRSIFTGFVQEEDRTQLAMNGFPHAVYILRMTHEARTESLRFIF